MNDDAKHLRFRLRQIGLTDPAIKAAWPEWWSKDAEESSSARTELRFSLARNLGLDPRSLLTDDEQPRFVWHDDARFKHLSDESQLVQAGINSFGHAVGCVLLAATPPAGHTIQRQARELRTNVTEEQAFVDLQALLLLCWRFGVPVIHLRVFPWPQKKMAAMAVRINNRHVILLAKDAVYPPHIAFYLAHEIGHIALNHMEGDSAIVDFEMKAPTLQVDDEEEKEADRFALELLTGNPDIKVLPKGNRYSASELARVALSTSPNLAVEPGTLALCFGYSTQKWAVANAALKQIYTQPKPVWHEVNKIAESFLDLDLVSGDSLHYLSTVLGRGL